MQPVRFVLDGEGTAQFLLSEGSLPIVENADVQRASNVLPMNVALRFVFQILRLVFGGSGAVADFTRSWKCQWHVDLAPIGKGKLPQTFDTRKEAIEAEILWLNENFI